jgi:DNA-directed RNA polymerase subunit N (RpoN/RPB10)
MNLIKKIKEKKEKEKGRNSELNNLGLIRSCSLRIFFNLKKK